MTMLYSSQGTIRFPIAVGQTLIVQNISGVETVSGSSASREDASARFGSGYFVYGPQSSAGTIQLSTTGQLDYQLVVGDATPWNNFIPLSGSSSGVSAGGDLAAGSAAVAAALGGYKRTTLSVAADSTCLSAGAVSSGTWMHSLTVPFPFDSVRVGFISTDATNSAAGLKIAVASSESAAGNGTQWPIVAGSRNDSMWSNATFGGAATGTPAAATSAANPSVTWTDWMPCKALTRTDGYNNFILLCRAYLPAAWAVQPGYSAVWSTKTASIAATPGEVYEVRQSGSDYIATPGGWTNSGTVGASPGLVFQFRARQPAHSVAFYGDSTFQGFAGSSTYSWAEMACRAIGLAHKNAGWSGQTTAQILTRLKADIGRGEKPTCIMIESASPNDASQAYTTATLYQDRSYVLDVIDQAQQIGAAVILTTPMPYVGTNTDASNQAAYLEHYAWVKSLETIPGRIRVLDFSSLHDATYPGKWGSGFSADGLHPNDAAKTLMSTLAQASIRATLNI